MKKLVVQNAAAADLLAVAEFISQTSEEAAFRFLDAANTEFLKLCRQPFLGRERQPIQSLLRNVRSWSISEFPQHIIFYRVEDECIRIVRVLHGARDIDQMLENEFQ